jgi:hypothetical protein
MSKSHKGLIEGFRGITEQGFPVVDRTPAPSIRASDAAVAAVKAASQVPSICGPDIPAAPARGAFRVFAPNSVRIGSAGQPVVERGGYQAPGEAAPRMAMEMLDPVSEVNAAARERYASVADDRPFRAPFTPGQVAIARHYAGLVEKQAAGGMKGIDLQGRSGASGGTGSLVDAQIRVSDELHHLRQRIGSGVAMSVRRVRPSKRGSPGASPIHDRRLVDMFCIEGKTFSDILRAHGWSVSGARVADLRHALSEALFRMQGYVRPRSTTP